MNYELKKFQLSGAGVDLGLLLFLFLLFVGDQVYQEIQLHGDVLAQGILATMQPDDGRAAHLALPPEVAANRSVDLVIHHILLKETRIFVVQQTGNLLDVHALGAAAGKHVHDVVMIDVLHLESNYLSTKIAQNRLKTKIDRQYFQYFCYLCLVKIDKIRNSMKKFRFALLLGLVAIAFAACNKDTYQHGTGLVRPQAGTYALVFADQTLDSVCFYTYDSYAVSTDASYVTVDSEWGAKKVINNYWTCW